MKLGSFLRDAFCSRETLAFGGTTILLAALLMTEAEFLLNNNNLVSLQLYFAPLCLVAVGMMLLFIVGMFDLSVGATMAAASMVCVAAVAAGASGVSAAAVGICVGVLVGGANGLLVLYVGINPLIATLGTMYILRGLVDTASGGGLPRPWMYITGDGVDAWLYRVGNIQIFGVFTIIWICLAVILAASLILRFTVLGRSLYLVGNNEAAARSVGLNARRTRFVLFLLCGALAALAGILVTARTGQATRFMGIGFEMQVIIACLVGGATIAGGRGSIAGAVAGVGLMTLISNAFNAWEIKSEWQRAILGAILLGLLLVDAVMQRTSRKRPGRLDHGGRASGTAAPHTGSGDTA